MNDCVQVCVEEVSVNPCMPIYVFTDRPNEYMVAYIKLNNGATITKQLKSDSRGVVSITDLSEYIINGVIELKFKAKDGLPIQVPFGDSCIAYCALELTVSQSQTDNFPNKKCSDAYNCSWSIPINNCTFSQTINNCSWVVKNMNKVIYNNTEFKISAEPTILVSNIVTVNPAYLAELTAISANFTASIIGNSLVVNYQGIGIVEFIDGCIAINKTCI